MFGMANTDKQNESTPFNPQSPYACAKAMAFYLTRYYRSAFGIFASTAILYNHESPRRMPEYVTRKVTQAAARISCGKQDKLVLGDMSAYIDWGYAKEYMETAWRILQLEQPDDFIVATGEAHSVREWVEKSFAAVNLKPDKYVVADPKLLRPTKTSSLVGDITKAKKTFGFDPKFKFEKLVNIMVEADLKKESLNANSL
jgi:GDPmannose 4,6-dehydratase